MLVAPSLRADGRKEIIDFRLAAGESDTLADVIRAPEMELSPCVSLIRGFAEPLHRLGIILGALRPSKAGFSRSVGNRVQVVAYSDIQLVKSPQVLRSLGLGRHEKSERAVRELANKRITSE